MMTAVVSASGASKGGVMVVAENFTEEPSRMQAASQLGACNPKVDGRKPDWCYWSAGQFNSYESSNGMGTASANGGRGRSPLEVDSTYNYSTGFYHYSMN